MGNVLNASQENVSIYNVILDSLVLMQNVLSSVSSPELADRGRCTMSDEHRYTKFYVVLVQDVVIFFDDLGPHVSRQVSMVHG